MTDIILVGLKRLKTLRFIFISYSAILTDVLADSESGTAAVVDFYTSISTYSCRSCTKLRLTKLLFGSQSSRSLIQCQASSYFARFCSYAHACIDCNRFECIKHVSRACIDSSKNALRERDVNSRLSKESTR